MESRKKRKVSFIEERDRRLAIVSKNSLWDVIRERVQINGRPCSKKTVERTFDAEAFKDLTPTRYRIWLAAAAVIDEYEKEAAEYDN